MDKTRELLKEAAERLARHSNNVPDMVLGDTIYKHLREIKPGTPQQTEKAN